VKNQQTTISTEEKLEVISQLEQGEQIINICHNVRFAHSSACTLCDNVNRIAESAR
jgi:hypothetical protein